jgi:hypothetical protein
MSKLTLITDYFLLIMSAMNVGRAIEQNNISAALGWGLVILIEIKYLIYRNEKENNDGIQIKSGRE